MPIFSRRHWACCLPIHQQHTQQHIHTYNRRNAPIQRRNAPIQQTQCSHTTDAMPDIHLLTGAVKQLLSHTHTHIQTHTDTQDARHMSIHSQSSQTHSIHSQSIHSGVKPAAPLCMHTHTHVYTHTHIQLYTHSGRKVYVNPFTAVLNLLLPSRPPTRYLPNKLCLSLALSPPLADDVGHVAEVYVSETEM